MMEGKNASRVCARLERRSEPRPPDRRAARRGLCKIYREKAARKDMRNRPKLAKAIDAPPTGGVLVLAEWDRCTRSMIDGIDIMERTAARGAFVKVDRVDLDLDDADRPRLPGVPECAEDERQRIMSRANAGRAAAKARGLIRPQAAPDRASDLRWTQALHAGKSAQAIARDLRLPPSDRCPPEGCLGGLKWVSASTSAPRAAS
jgi:DNA invertase Pin-like site-specific DNA recombinase